MEHNEQKPMNEQNQEQTPEVELVKPAVVAPTPEEESFKDQFMRMSADFANYRRRMDKERITWMQTGQNAIIVSFLPLLDDIERALEATKKTAASEQDHAGLQSVLAGFVLIEKNMRKTLADLGVEEIDCSGAFDPMLHEALMQQAIEGKESGAIIQVLCKGYMYKGTVVRHAKVSVVA